jgi:hypothetical protein
MTGLCKKCLNSNVELIVSKKGALCERCYAVAMDKKKN